MTSNKPGTAVPVAALLGLASLGALAQDSITVYGRADMSVSRQTRIFVAGKPTSASVTALDSGGSNGSRVGFRGTEDLGDGLKALFVLEQGIQLDTGNLGQSGRGFGRQAYVGLEGRFGRLTAGRQYTPYFDTLSTADAFGNNFVGNSGNVAFANARADNMLLYRSPTLGGFTLQAMHAFGEGTTGRQQNLSLGYRQGGLWLGAAWGAYKHATRGSFVVAGASYELGPVRLHAGAARLRDIDPTALAAPVLAPGARGQNWLVGAQWRVGVGTLMASVVQLDDRRSVDRDARQLAVAYNHALSRRTALYGGFARISNRNGGTLTTNTPSYPGRGEAQTQAGISHVF